MQVTATAQGRHATTFSAATAPVAGRGDRTGRRRAAAGRTAAVADRGAPQSRRDPAGSAGDRARRPAQTGADGRAASRRSDPVARVLVETPAGPPRPARSTTPCRPRWPTPRCRAPGSRCGSPARTSTASSSGAAPDTDHTGALTPLRRVVSPEPVLSPAIAELAGLLAERYAGTRADVLRLAVPPRHATTEKQPSPRRGAGRRRPAAAATAAWGAYPAAEAFLAHLAAGGSPRAVWSALPGEDWPRLLAQAAAADPRGWPGSVLCVPDHRDVARLDAALTAVLGAGHHVVLTAGAGPARRYREFLAVARGTRRIVVGTRAAAFAPVHDLGSGGDLGRRRRPPCRAARAVPPRPRGAADPRPGRGRRGAGRRLRPQRRGRAAARHRLGPRARRRRARRCAPPSRCPSPAPPTSSSSATRSPGPPGCPSRSPTRCRPAWSHGPGPRPHAPPGYAASLACERCRTPARCDGLHRPARRARSGRARRPAAGAAPSSTPGPARSCGHRGLRAPVVGERRTAEELGRAFASTPVVASGGDHVVAVGAGPPRDRGGHAGRRTGGRGRLRRRGGARHLARPGPTRPSHRGGGAAPLVRRGRAGRTRRRAWSWSATRRCPVVQALVRWDPAGFAQREAAARAEAHLPPASRLATVTGEPGAVDDAFTLLDRPPGTEVLGPGRGRRRAVPGRRPRAARPRCGAVTRPGRGAAGALGPQARRGPHPGRPGHPLRSGFAGSRLLRGVGDQLWGLPGGDPHLP